MAAVEFNAGGEEGFVNPSGSISRSITLPSTGDNRLFVVHVGLTFFFGPTIGAGTLGGQGLTQIWEDESEGSFAVGTYYMVDPPTGANTLTIASNAPSNGSASLVWAVFNNVDPDTPWDGSAVTLVDSGSAGTTISSISGVPDGMGVSGGSAGGALTFFGTGTEINDIDADDSGTHTTTAMYYLARSNSDAFSMTIARGNGTGFGGFFGQCLQPLATASGTKRRNPFFFSLAGLAIPAGLIVNGVARVS